MGEVTPNARATSYHFDYGATTAYGTSTPDQSAGSGLVPVGATAAVSGLASDTTYHYRLVATNADGTSLSSDGTFTTTATTSGGSTGGAGGAGSGPTAVTVEHVLPGRRVARACLAPSSARRGKPKCTRYRRIGSFVINARAGLSRTRFTGRFGRHTLVRGRYLMIMVATDSARRRSKARRLAFRVN